AQYVHTEGTKIVDGTGKPIFFSGMNLGNWLVWEGYLMMGDYNYRTHTQFFNSLKNVLGGFDQAMAFEHQWRLNYVNEQAIIDLKNLGFNSVRVPFNYNMFWYNGAVSDGGFQYFDRLIEYCRKHNVYILLDMHAAPGYQNPGDHSDNINSNSSQPRDSVKFWDNGNVDIAAKVWRHIANRYKTEPIIWGYDLINEPVPQDGREYELLPSLIKIRNAIREVDPNHTIVAEASWWASDMSKIDWSNPTTQSRTGVSSKWDNNLVYETHHYVFGNAAAVQDLNGRRDVTNKLGIPLILGEMGEDTPAILRTMSDWATNNIAGYFPWSFKKMSHDRTLWTIQPNAIYNQVKTSINSGEYVVSGAAQGMVDFAQRNIANGVAGLQWHQDFYDSVRPVNVPVTPTTPASGPLTLYQNCCFGGYAVNVPVGDHNLAS
ncbi:MAG: endoglucanase, partial [Moraxellaceae bacterium]